MDGYVAKLKEICGLADRYGALVLVDDCHATGHLGEKGRGTPALTGAGDRVDIVTGTFGKTLGGGMGGFVAAAQPIVDLLRQRARPYLFSNSLAPPIAAGALKALEIAIGADARRALLKNHARRFREGVEKAGFKVAPGETPIIPVMLGEARLAQDLARALDERGVFVAGFFFPVVPKGQARIRTQMSAALTEADIDFAIGAFEDAGKALGNRLGTGPRLERFDRGRRCRCSGRCEGRETMAGELKGKVAAVTGAASGIGLASCEAMLALGARVAMIDRDEAALMRLREKHGDAVIPLVIDLLDPKDCATLLPRSSRGRAGSTSCTPTRAFTSAAIWSRPTSAPSTGCST